VGRFWSPSPPLFPRTGREGFLARFGGGDGREGRGGAPCDPDRAFLTEEEYEASLEAAGLRVDRQDQAMADEMSSYWVNFARTGDPNGRGLPDWPRFSDRNAPLHVLGDIEEYPSVETLNAYDEPYAQILRQLGEGRN
jgi:hypothetical protein